MKVVSKRNAIFGAVAALAGALFFWRKGGHRHHPSTT